MQAAFLLLIFFPPPAASTFRLAKANGARARRAPDRREATVVQDVVGDAIIGNVVGDLLRRPIGKWIDFDEIMRLVEFGERRRAAMMGLFGAQSGHPGARARKRAAQRLALANCAASLPVFRRGAETIDAIFANEGFYKLAIRH